MIQSRLVLATILTISLFLISCATPDVDEGVNKLRPNVNTNSNVIVDPNANKAEDSEIKLETLIKLPFEPVENIYREDERGKVANDNRVIDPKDRTLTAVLKFSEEDTIKLTEQLESDGEPFDSTIEPETWFPAELIAKSQLSGDETISGLGFNARLFYKSPYTKGTVTKFKETEYFVLVLNTQ